MKVTTLLYICLFLIVTSASATEKTVTEILTSEGSGSFEENSLGLKKKDKGITSCSCPGFSYTLGSQSRHASECSASCPAPRYASCSCRVASYQVAGAYYNKCNCKK